MKAGTRSEPGLRGLPRRRSRSWVAMLTMLGGLALIAIGPAAGASAAGQRSPAASHGTGPPFVFAYITNLRADTVSVVQTATNAIVATIPVGDSPTAVAVAPDGRHVYVANAVSGSVSVIDTATNTVTATVSLPAGSAPLGIAVTPNDRTLYVTDSGANDVSVIDTATNAVIAVIRTDAEGNAVFNRPVGVAVTPDGRRVYVASSGRLLDIGDTVAVIDTATNTVTGTIEVGFGPTAVAVAPNGRHVYVANDTPSRFGQGSVSVIATATNQVTATISGFEEPVGVAAAQNGRVYVTVIDTNEVAVIATPTNRVTTIRGFDSPVGVAVTPNGRLVYVTNTGRSSNVAVITAATSTLTRTITGFTFPQAVAIGTVRTGGWPKR